MDWIHWIGKSYYSINAFLKEGRDEGITRRVAPQIFKKMKWGDFVYCVQKENGKKKGSVFCMFPITLLSGLSDEAGMEVVDTFACEKIDDGGNKVDRGCGEYIAGPSYAVDADLQEITELLIKKKDEGMDIGKVMIGCRPQDVEELEEPYPMLANVPYQMGFRGFDSEAFWSAVAEQDVPAIEKKKRAIVKGQFYHERRDPDEKAAEVRARHAQIVMQYCKGQPKKKKKKTKAPNPQMALSI